VPSLPLQPAHTAGNTAATLVSTHKPESEMEKGIAALLAEHGLSDKRITQAEQARPRQHSSAISHHSSLISHQPSAITHQSSRGTDKRITQAEQERRGILLT